MVLFKFPRRHAHATTQAKLDGLFAQMDHQLTRDNAMQMREIMADARISTAALNYLFYISNGYDYPLTDEADQRLKKLELIEPDGKIKPDVVNMMRKNYRLEGEKLAPIKSKKQNGATISAPAF